MKTLFLVRHAKSSWKHANLTDHDRPLSERGERDAPFMGELLKKHNVIPDVIICSTAARAKQTAELLSGGMGFPKSKIEFEKNIYESTSGMLLDIINSKNGDYNSLMIIGHNPGMTTLSSYLSGEYIDNLPTCSIAAIRFDIDDWAKIGTEKGDLIWLEYPKKYLHK